MEGFPYEMILHIIRFAVETPVDFARLSSVARTWHSLLRGARRDLTCDIRMRVLESRQVFLKRINTARIGIMRLQRYSVESLEEAGDEKKKLPKYHLDSFRDFHEALQAESACIYLLQLSSSSGEVLGENLLWVTLAYSTFCVALLFATLSFWHGYVSLWPIYVLSGVLALSVMPVFCHALCFYTFLVRAVARLNRIGKRLRASIAVPRVSGWCRSLKTGVAVLGAIAALLILRFFYGPESEMTWWKRVVPLCVLLFGSSRQFFKYVLLPLPRAYRPHLGGIGVGVAIVWILLLANFELVPLGGLSSPLGIVLTSIALVMMVLVSTSPRNCELSRLAVAFQRFMWVSTGPFTVLFVYAGFPSWIVGLPFVLWATIGMIRLHWSVMLARHRALVVGQFCGIWRRLFLYWKKGHEAWKLVQTTIRERKCLH